VRTVNIQHAEKCRRCSATGKINGLPCPLCHGNKQHVTERRVEVKLPAGLKTGAKVRIAQDGEPGMAGGEPGDLFLTVRLAKHPALKIEGMHVLCDIPVTIPEAVLGATIEVPTLHGNLQMTLPPLTGSGAVLRLKGQGVSLHGTVGDQLVTVRIVAPSRLSPEERSHYEALALLYKGSPRN
jgi:molecular chaperone DnaJ